MGVLNGHPSQCLIFVSKSNLQTYNSVVEDNVESFNEHTGVIVFELCIFIFMEVVNKDCECQFCVAVCLHAGGIGGAYNCIWGKSKVIKRSLQFKEVFKI